MILTMGEEEKLRRFDRKIYDSKKVVGVYQRLTNSEVQERLQGKNIVKTIKTQTAMVRPHKKDQRRKSSEESDIVQTRL